MNPSQFHVDWDRATEMLVAVVILSMLVERSLSVVFESRLFLDSKADRKGAKEVIALIVSFAVCRYWDFDAVSALLPAERTHLGGHFITAGVIAGGSKGSIKLFRDVLGFRSSAVAEKEEAKAVAKAAAAAPGGQAIAAAAAAGGKV